MCTSAVWWGDPDILARVLGLLDCVSLSRAASVCRYWREVIASHAVWTQLLERDFAAFLESAPRPYPPQPPTQREMLQEQKCIAAFYGRTVSAADLAAVVERLPAARAETPPPQLQHDEQSSRSLYQYLAGACRRCTFVGQWASARDPSQTFRIEQSGYRVTAFEQLPGGRELFRVTLDRTLQHGSGHVQLFHSTAPWGGACWARAVVHVCDMHTLALRWTTSHLTDFDGPAAQPALPYFVTRYFRRCGYREASAQSPLGDIPQSEGDMSCGSAVLDELTEDEQLELATFDGGDEFEEEPLL